VNQKEVDVVGLQRFERGVERPARVVGSVVPVVELAGDEALGPVDAGVRDAGSDTPGQVGVDRVLPLLGRNLL
jgi:hypothetical protein